MSPSPSTRNSKRWLARALVTLAVFIYAPVAQSRVVDPSGWVEPEVVSICAIMAEAHDLEAPAPHCSYGALDAVHAFAERHLRRPAGSERLDDEAQASYQQLLAPLSLDQRHELVQLFSALGDFGAVQPQDLHYDYIFIHGSTVPSMRRRLAALATQVQQKALDIGPNTRVIFFDGERPLFAKETLEVLLNPSPYTPDPTFTPPPEEPKDERQAAEMVYRQLWLPTPLRDAPVHFVHAPAEMGETRAHTRGVVRHWVDMDHPRGGRALMVSDSPFVEYQRLATLMALREANGPAIDIVPMGPEGGLIDGLSDTALGVRLDNLAACIALAKELRDSEDEGLQSALLP